jgi:hypothetical protein
MGPNEKIMLAFFIISAVLLFLAVKFFYDQVYRRKP